MAWDTVTTRDTGEFPRKISTLSKSSLMMCLSGVVPDLTYWWHVFILPKCIVYSIFRSGILVSCFCRASLFLYKLRSISVFPYGVWHVAGQINDWILQVSFGLCKILT